MGFTRCLALWCLWYLCLCALVLPQVFKARPAAVAPLYPAPPMILVQPTELPFAVLSGAERLVSSRLGVAAIPSAEGIAWRELAASRNAEAEFGRLLKFGSVAGQLYALAYFYRTDPALFRVHATRIQSLESKLDVVQGCSLRPAVPVWELLREIAAGRWTRDLESPMMSGCDTPSAPHLEPSQRGDRIRSVSPS
jgi:hypothetical protein